MPNYLTVFLNFWRINFIFLIAAISYPFAAHKAVYFFLKQSGPTFIKLGQLLSTRSDLIGEELAKTLSVFQDKLSPFSFSKVNKIIQSEFGKEITELFAEFAPSPVACASIAQTHRAKTLQGEEIAVKILRPQIDKLMARDIATLKFLLTIIGIFAIHTKNKLSNLVTLLENCREKELDMLYEASSAIDLKEKLKNLEGFYIPKIYWQLTSHKILTSEWIDGIAFSNIKAIQASNFDKKQIAKNLVIAYFNQVYIHGVFHADMHPGNLFLMANGDIGAVDFGIIGTISKKMRIAVAEILLGFLNRDYKKIAAIHIRSGLIPPDTNIDEFAKSARIIGESIVDLSVKQISLAKLLTHLIKMTKKYNMNTDAELLLLQKTLLLVEGVGAALDPDLNIWELANPWMREWAVKNIGFDAKIRDAFVDALEIIKKLPSMIDDKKINENQNLKDEILQLKYREGKWKIIALISLISLISLVVFILYVLGAV